MALLPNLSFCSTFTRRSTSSISFLPIFACPHPHSTFCSQAHPDTTTTTNPVHTFWHSAKHQSEILRIREALLSRERTAVEITEAYLSRLKDVEPKVKSFLFVSEQALKEAEELDKRIAAKEPLGSLAGVPFAVKDNLCTVDMPSTGGSKILENYHPPFDATAVRKMKEAGALCLGKTNLDEFGMGSSTEASAFQVTCNPWDLSRVPGGSSGGSAAAVSARQCVCSLGSDTGGSIRQPASFCGVVGLKPSYGRVSRYGLMAFASSLDVIGCFGTSVQDVAIILESIAGHDKHDATSSLMPVPEYAVKLPKLNALDSKPLDGLCIGLVVDTVGNGVDPGVSSVIATAVSHLENLGAKITEVTLPSFSQGLPAYYILACSEASSNLARYDGARYGNRSPADELTLMYGDTRGNGFGKEVKRRILMGTYALSAGFYDAYYKRAQQIRTMVQNDFKRALGECDLLVTPAAPTAAYSIGGKTDDPLAMYAGDLMTVNVNLAGLPALVAPCGFTKENVQLPVGIQFIAKCFEEGNLLRIGHIFEQTLDTSQFLPPII